MLPLPVPGVLKLAWVQVRGERAAGPRPGDAADGCAVLQAAVQVLEVASNLRYNVLVAAFAHVHGGISNSKRWREQTETDRRTVNCVNVAAALQIASAGTGIGFIIFI